MALLKFSPANSKLQKLEKKISKKVYSLDTLSGINCIGAKDCFAKVVVKKGKRSLVRGPHTQFTCYSASLENVYGNVYKLRKYNTDLLKSISSKKDLVNLIQNSLPKKAEVIRIHSAGDFFSQQYFDAWIETAKNNPNMEFYAYTKSLPFWIKRISEIPNNFRLTASRGGKWDNLIDEHSLREAKVVFSEEEAKNLDFEIDENDYHAYRESKESFALLIHGQGEKGSLQSKAFGQRRVSDKIKKKEN